MRTAITPDGLLDLIRKSGLIDDQHLAAYAPPPDTDDPAMAARELAARLVRDRLLTGFQAKHLLAGRHRGFFITGKYKVFAHLGSGGMGHVYLCEHLMLHRLVAIKKLALTGGAEAKEAAERFLREARAAAAVDHPNVVRVFDKDRDGDDPFLVMEYVDGTSLHDLVTAHGPLPTDRAADCGRQAALGLQHAHDLGLIHRDIKPGNLLLDRAGTVKVLDLGLARFVIDEGRNANLTARFDGTVVGTADYIAPEQANDSAAADHRSDQYALGGTLYYLLTGRPPFPDGTLSQKMMWHQSRMPVPVRDRRPDVPDGLAAVVERMLAKAPADRFPSHADAAEALAAFAAAPSRPPSAQMPRVPPTAYKLGLCDGPPAADGPGSGGAVTPSPGRAEMDTDSAPVRPPGSAPKRSGPLPPPPVRRPAPGKLTAPGRNPPRTTPPAAEPVATAPPRARRRPLIVGAVVLLLAAAALGGVLLYRPGMPAAGGFASPSAEGELKIGGATFIQPVMEHWAAEYHKQTGVAVTYTGGGSGRGVRGVLAKELHVGCTSMPLSDDELARATAIGGPLLHLPLALGAVVPAYKLPGAPDGLRFTGELLADIFLGKVTTWNDPALRAANPGVSLPDARIQVVHRSDSSGTTYNWTAYLTANSGAWKETHGPRPGFAVWPAGVGARGDAGVAEAVGQTFGAIGYMEQSVAAAGGLSVGRVRNQSGRFVEPGVKSVEVAAAAKLKSIPTDLRFELLDADADGAYPIAGAVWAVLYVRPPGGHPPGLVDFLWWATHDGQAALSGLRYAPLPAELVALVETKLRPLRK